MFFDVPNDPLYEYLAYTLPFSETLIWVPSAYVVPSRLSWITYFGSSFETAVTILFWFVQSGLSTERSILDPAGIGSALVTKLFDSLTWTFPALSITLVHT